MTVEWRNPRPMSDVYARHPVCDVWPIWGWGCPVSQRIILGPADGCRRLSQIWFSRCHPSSLQTRPHPAMNFPDCSRRPCAPAFRTAWWICLSVKRRLLSFRLRDASPCDPAIYLTLSQSAARFNGRYLPFKAARTIMQRNVQSYFCARAVGSNTSYASAFTRFLSSSDRVKRSRRSKYPIKFSSVILTDELARGSHGFKGRRNLSRRFFFFFLLEEKPSKKKNTL